MPATRLPPRAAFLLLASIIIAFLAGSSAPTPLYAHYQALWGFSPITVTIVFGVYAIAVLAALLTLGSLSDHVGRRPVLIAATLVQAAAMLLFVRADGVGALLAARIVQGIATGAAAGAVGAGMLDIDRVRGTTANAVAPMIGTGTGALLSGLLVQFLPAPTTLVYLLLFGVFLAQAVGVAFMRETSPRVAGALRSLVPHFRVPAAARAHVWRAVPALVAAWALIGFYGALAPTLVRQLVGVHSPALGGLALTVIAFGGVSIVLATKARAASSLLAFGAIALIGGVATTLAAVSSGSVVGFFAGSALAGTGFGAAFQGAIRTVVPLAAPHERAGVLSVLYVVSYLAMGAPAVLAGVLVVHNGSVVATAQLYGAAVAVLALFALIGTLRASVSTAARERVTVGG